MKPWIEATRPKTLPASIIPVMIGNAAAFAENKFNPIVMLITMFCALMIQIITNYLNEVYDFKKGADTKDRLGPKRQVASGVISAKMMSIVSIILILITFLTGLYLVDYAGIEILIVGILSLFFAFAYTGGPYPLAYNGLGEIFVFVFFGLVAVCGSYYVQTQNLNLFIVLAAIPAGMLSSNILGVNNIRDIETDKLANKKTLAVKIGKSNAIKLFEFEIASAYAAIVILSILYNNYILLLPLLTIFLSIRLIKNVKTLVGLELNKALAATGKLLLIFGLLQCISMIIRF